MSADFSISRVSQVVNVNLALLSVVTFVLKCIMMDHLGYSYLLSLVKLCLLREVLLDFYSITKRFRGQYYRESILFLFAYHHDLKVVVFGV